MAMTNYVNLVSSINKNNKVKCEYYSNKATNNIIIKLTHLTVKWHIFFIKTSHRMGDQQTNQA